MRHPFRPLARLAVFCSLTTLSLSCGGGDGGGSTGPSPNPAPTLTSLSRDTVTAGGTPFALTVKGTKFVTGLLGLVDSVERTTDRASDSIATITLIAADIAASGDRQIRVANPEPGGGASGALLLHVLPAPPAPTLDSITPSSILAGHPGFTLHAFGTGFTPASVIRWGGTSLTTALTSATHLTATVSAALVADSGSVPVTIMTPGPGGGTSAARVFAAQIRPVITRVDTALLKNRPDTIPLPLHGASLTGTDTVDVIQNGIARHLTATSSSDTLAVATMDRSKLVPYSQPFLRVHAHGTWSDTIVVGVLAGAPLITVTAATPDTLDAGKSIDTIVVTGHGFTAHTKLASARIGFAQTFLDSTHVRGMLNQNNLLDLAGPGTITVFDEADSTIADSLPIAIRTPAPVIDSVVPGAVAVGSGPREVWLTSHDLSIRGTVRVNGVVHPIDLGNSGGGVVGMVLDSLELASPDTLQITFANPDPTNGPADTVFLPVLPVNPTPTNDSISIDHVIAGHAPSMTIYGNHFVPGVRIEYLVNDGNFDIAHSVIATWIDSTKISVVIPDSSAAPGSLIHFQTLNPEPTPGPGFVPNITVWSTGIRDVATVFAGTTQDLIGDDRRGLVYATIGYSIRPFDVHTHTLAAAQINIPNAPTRTVMGADTNSVWMSTTGGGARVYRVDLNSWTISDSIVILHPNVGMSDVIALPGHVDAVVTSQLVIDTLTGGHTSVLTVFDGTTARIDTLSFIDGSVRFVGFAGGDTLVAQVNSLAAPSLLRAVVDSNGIHQVALLPFVSSTQRGVLSSNGILLERTLYNATTGAIIHDLYPWASTPAADDPLHHRMIVALFAQDGSTITTIFPLNPATGVAGSADILSTMGAVGPATRFGPDGFAFGDGSGRVVFVRAAAIEN